MNKDSGNHRSEPERTVKDHVGKTPVNGAKKKGAPEPAWARGAATSTLGRASSCLEQLFGAPIGTASSGEEGPCGDFDTPLHGV